MKIDALASESQYLEMCAPIWCALDPSLRGEFLTADHLFPRARTLGVEPTAWHEPFARVGLVASERDLRFLRGKPAILAEHGAGQSYSGRSESARHPGYAGGDNRENVILFLNPGEQCAERNRARYPDTPSVEIGNPRLDALREIPSTNHPDTIAFAFHWAAGICAESGTAWYHWRDHLDMLGEHYRLLGTGHPRGFQEMADWYEKHGIIPVEDFEIVVAEADLLVADNTGVMYEWAALDRPVVALNSPTWDRRVNHGLRFWNHIPGPQADIPADLLIAVDKADDRHSRKLRSEAARAAYTYPDNAAKRAAEAIHQVLDALP
jgi:hypothetical protein